jgi:hypothetical protein
MTEPFPSSTARPSNPSNPSTGAIRGLMVPLRTAHLLAKRPRADGILLAKRPLSKTALTAPSARTSKSRNRGCGNDSLRR